MQLTGIEGEHVVLLLEDYQFVEGQFLELINSLLSAGEVPGLYSPEELEPLLGPLRDEASEANFRGTVAQYFANREYISCEDVCLLVVVWLGCRVGGGGRGIMAVKCIGGMSYSHDLVSRDMASLRNRGRDICSFSLLRAYVFLGRIAIN